MTNELIDLKNLPSIDGMFSGSSADDMIAGSSGSGFPIISIKGSKFRIRNVDGEIEAVRDENGDPTPTMEMIIIDSQKGLSKSWYAEDYNDGDATSPDCVSDDGEKPRPDSRNPQHDNCQSCPKNAWGSAPPKMVRGVLTASKGKACKDAKRLAVTFATNIDNPELGGPMMLRVPGTSHRPMDKFALGMRARGYRTQQIAVRLGFDVNASYPLLTFKALRPLTDPEVTKVSEWYHSQQVADILNGQQHSDQVKASRVPPPAAPATAAVVEDDPLEFEVPAPAPEAAPEVAETPKPAKKVAKPKIVPPPAPKAEETPAEVRGDLGEIMAGLEDF